jgi:hypothetical protein
MEPYLLLVLGFIVVWCGYAAIRLRLILLASTITCPICSCVVANDDKLDHAEWHEKMRQAVDETGTLG